MRIFLRSTVFLIAAAVASSLEAHAQARPTAERTTRLSVFAGATGTETGLYNGRNAGITAGVDLEVRRFFGLQPAIEVRGSYPVSDGNSVALKNGLGGLRVEKSLGRIHPYGAVFFGRGELNYQNGGLLSKDGSTIYLQSLSNVYSGGGGVDLDLTTHFGVKVDVQMQHYNSPITNSGSEWAKSATIGVVYRLALGGYRGER